MYSSIKKCSSTLFSDSSEVWLKGENETKCNDTGQTRVCVYIVEQQQLKCSTVKHREQTQGKGLKGNSILSTLMPFHMTLIYQMNAN